MTTFLLMGRWKKVGGRLVRNKSDSSYTSGKTSSGGSVLTVPSNTTRTGTQNGATFTQTTTAPEYSSIRSTDYVDASGAGAGSTTVQGKNVWTRRSGGGSSSSGSSNATVVSTTFDKPTTQKLTGVKTTQPTNQANTLTAPTEERATFSAAQPLSVRTEKKADIGFWGATVATAKQFGGNVGMIFSNRDYDFKNENYYQYTGASKPDKVAYTVPVFGTVTPETSTGFETTTYKDIQVETEFKRELLKGQAESERKKAQDKIDAGADYDDTVSGYNTNIANINSQYSQLNDVTGYTKGRYEDVPKYADTATGITLSVINPALGVGYYGAKGIAGIAKIPVSTDPSFYGGEITLTSEQKQIQNEAAINLLTAGALGVASVYKIGGDITKLRLQEGRATTGITKGRIMNSQFGDDTFKVMETTRKGTPSYELFSKRQYFQTIKPDGTVGISGGSGRTTERVLDFMKQGTGAYEYNVASKPFTFFGEAIPQAVKGSKTTFLGSITSTTDDVVRTKTFIGGSQASDDFTLGVSGSVKGARFKPTTTTYNLDTGTTTIGGKTTLISGVDDLSFTKNVRFKTGDFKFTRGSKGGKFSGFDIIDDVSDDVVRGTKSGSGGSEVKPTGSIKPVFSGNNLVLQNIDEVTTKLVNTNKVGLGVINAPAVKLTQGVRFAPALISGVSSATTSTLKPALLQSPSLTQIPTTTLDQSTSLGLASATALKTPTATTTKLVIPTVGTGGVIGGGAGSVGTILAGGFPNFNIGGAGGSPRSRRVKTKAKYGYTPDYTSIVFGRRGKATKGSFGGKFSGFEARPVTEGWAKSIGGAFGVFGNKKKKKKK